MEFILIPTGSLLIVFALFMLYFARNPTRELLLDDKTILSPANGRVAKIEEYNHSAQIKKWNGVTSLYKGVAKKGLVITIIMTPLNVHYQRAPHTGVVEKTQYTKGLFGYALTTQSTFKNERNEIIIKGPHGSSKTVQVAGMLARRILCYAKEQETLRAGSTIGFITYGSQTLLFLPENTRLSIREGDTVLDAQKIGEWV